MTLEERRFRKIQGIIHTLDKCKQAGISVNYENLIREVNLKFGSSRRTSMDYIDSAMKATNMVIVEVDHEKEIISKNISYNEIKRGNSNIFTELKKEELDKIIK